MNSRERVLSAFERRGYPDDYLELCRIIGQDAIVLENLWTSIKRRQPDGSLVPWNDHRRRRLLLTHEFVRCCRKLLTSGNRLRVQATPYL